MKRRSLLLGALGVLAAGVSVGCGSPATPPEAKHREIGPSWADVFDTVPDLYAVVRPQALKADPLYGAFWNVLLREAAARGFTRGTTMVEAVSGAQEIIVGLNKGNDAVIVLRGVPANLDPASMNDAAGHPLFRSVNEKGRVLELAFLGAGNADIGALFVLPDRTWVGVVGEARLRARQAFSTPLNRPVPRVDREALVAVRLGGAAARIFDRGPRLSLVTQKMTSATFALEPNKKGLVIALVYPDPDATARAELQAKRVVEDLAHDEKRFGWLKDAKVKYEGNIVFVRAQLPPQLLEDLPRAAPSDVSL